MKALIVAVLFVVFMNWGPALAQTSTPVPTLTPKPTQIWFYCDELGLGPPGECVVPFSIQWNTGNNTNCEGDLPCGPLPWQLPILPVLVSPTPFTVWDISGNPGDPEESDESMYGFFDDITSTSLEIGELDEETIEQISLNTSLFMGYVNAVRQIDLGVMTPAVVFMFGLAAASISLKLILLMAPVIALIIGVVRKAWGMLPFT